MHPENVPNTPLHCQQQTLGELAGSCSLPKVGYKTARTKKLSMGSDIIHKLRGILNVERKRPFLSTSLKLSKHLTYRNDTTPLNGNNLSIS